MPARILTELSRGVLHASELRERLGVSRPTLMRMARDGGPDVIRIGRGPATQYALFSSLYALPGKLIASQSGRIVESSAAAADVGGPMAGRKALFSGLPPEAFAGAMAKSGVTPQALGAGYLVFFLYSWAIGAVAIVLS